MPINKESIKQFLKENFYEEITFSPKGNEIWRPVYPYNSPVEAPNELPHDNFIKLTYYQSRSSDPGIIISGKYKSSVQEIKENNTDFLTELFKWAKKEKVKKIETKQETESPPNDHVEIKGTVKEVIIVKKTQQDYKNDREAYARRADQMIANRKCFY